ncbi:MAG: hypothetical protein ACM34M_01890 [Ignavibacteria bacterium]
MKSLFLSIFLLVVSGSLFAVQPDSVDVEKGKSREVIKKDNSSGDELTARKQVRKKSTRKMDVFIDKDGDGISDQRASGMGLDKMRKRFRGSKGGGQGQNQGGNGNGGHGGR